MKYEFDSKKIAEIRFHKCKHLAMGIEPLNSVWYVGIFEMFTFLKSNFGKCFVIDAYLILSYFVWAIASIS